MKTWRACAAALAASVAGEACAFLDTGTLLTNAASATYMGGGQATQVTYSATAKILVANPAVFLWKDCTPTYVATSGGLVTCQICFSNGGANTAFKVTVNDRLPNNSYWQTAGYGFWAAGASVQQASWATAIGGPWTAGTPLNGQFVPLFLRWVVSPLGIGNSGCIQFVLSIG